MCVRACVEIPQVMGILLQLQVMLLSNIHLSRFVTTKFCNLQL